MVGAENLPPTTEVAATAGRPAPQVIDSPPVMVTSDRMPAYRTVLDAEGVTGVADVSIMGDEQQVVAQSRRLAEAGMTEFVGLLYDDPDTVARTSTPMAGMRL